jgi:hypothetical protein
VIVSLCQAFAILVVVVNPTFHHDLKFISGLLHWWLQYIIQCTFYSGCDAFGVWQDTLFTSMLATDGSCEIDPNGGLQLLLLCADFACTTQPRPTRP